MTDAATLLPPNASAFEHAAEQSTAPHDHSGPLHDLALPDRISAASLANLAWGEDVPLWPSTDAARRRITADSHRLHGLIGTEAGLRAGARWVKAKITHVNRPPAKTFIGGRDEAARRRWLDAQPQLRLYPTREKNIEQGLSLSHAFLGATPPTRTDALARATVLAVRWYQGVETRLTAREWHQNSNKILTLAVPAPATGIYPGAVHITAADTYGPYPGKSTAANRLLTIDQSGYRLATAVPNMHVLQPSTDPLPPDAEVITRRVVLPGLSCLVDHRRKSSDQGGVFLGQINPSASVAGHHLYYRITVHDQTIAAPLSRGLAFLGQTRINMPPHHAEVRLALSPEVSESAHLGRAGISYPARRPVNERINPALNALNWFRGAADHITIDTQSHQSVRANQTLPAGQTLAGAIIPRN